MDHWHLLSMEYAACSQDDMRLLMQVLTTYVKLICSYEYFGCYQQYLCKNYYVTVSNSTASQQQQFSRYQEILRKFISQFCYKIGSQLFTIVNSNYLRYNLVVIFIFFFSFFVSLCKIFKSTICIKLKRLFFISPIRKLFL